MAGVRQSLLCPVSRSQPEMSKLIQELKDMVENKQKPKSSSAKGTTGVCVCVCVWVCVGVYVAVYVAVCVCVCVWVCVGVCGWVWVGGWLCVCVCVCVCVCMHTRKSYIDLPFS